MVLHANAVAQNRPACVWTSRIDRDDADGAFFLAIVAGQLIDQRALTRTRRAGEPENSRMPAVRKESLEQYGPARRAILDRADGTGQSAQIAGAKLVNPLLDFGFQDVQCKAAGGNWEPEPKVSLWQGLGSFDHLLGTRPHTIVFRQVHPADHA